MRSTQYGVRIKSFEARNIYEYNLGINFDYTYKKAMFPNSLLLNFLKENGLKIKNGATEDIICLKFNQDSRSYEKEIEHWDYIIEHKHSKKDKNKIYSDEDIEYFKKKRKNVVIKKNLFTPKTKEEIRVDFYENGVDVTHIDYGDREKTIIKNQRTIHYKMFYRSTGKAKTGECMFICERLFNKAQKFLRMGLKLPKTNAPIVEMSAYSSLVSSTIVGVVKIDPRDILILNDVDSFFKTNVTSIETDEDKHCVAIRRDGYELKNTLFDGQGLIDESIFPTWGDGYVLLRQHMTKMACFKTKIQKFFKDYYGDKYETAEVEDMFGNKHCVKDIKLITTDNAMKWLKFGVSYQYWCDKVGENGNLFGVVKTAHKSKLGDVQKMSYQMINSLNLDTMPQVLEKSVDYITALKTNDEVFLDYLRRNMNFSNDYKVLVAICEANPEFIRSRYFRERRWDIIKNYVKVFKSGKVIQNGDNLVIVGSPYAMLLHSVGEDVEKDPTFCAENDCMQCFTTRFDDDTYLAEFRNPFNSKANLGYLHNVYHEYMFKYFDLGDQIIAVNMIHTPFQDRNNGSDQDSDSIFCTNQRDIVDWAKHCYVAYPTVVNNIPKDGKKYDNTLSNFAMIDNNLAKAQAAIGSSSNIAQLAQTYTYNFDDKKYKDYVDILAVIAQISIDSAKRSFDIDINAELDRISKDMDIKNNKYPKFWKSIQDAKRIKKGDKPFSESQINPSLQCPMNYLYNIKLDRYRNTKDTLEMDYFFNKFELDANRRKSKKIEQLIENYSIILYRKDDIYDLGDDYSENTVSLELDYESLINEISRLYISNSYIGLTSWLIDRAFCITPQTKAKATRDYNKTKKNTDKNKSLLLKVLFDINPQNVIKCFSKNLEK